LATSRTGRATAQAGFDPSNDSLRLTELARTALTRDRVVVARDLLNQLLESKFENPMSHPAQKTHYRREYVPAVELARVRQWIGRARAARARSRAFIGFLRRYASAMEYRARRRARIRAGLA